MNKKYKNKYRIKSTRLQNWDYGWNGSYFITICTKNREIFFGEITSGIMQLSAIGKMAQKYWLSIPDHFPFVKLDAFVVMPNHIHGIITIDKNVVDTPKLGVSIHNIKKNIKETPKLGVSTTLGTIINQYKRICTINARKTNNQFAWQSRFYDHIIRNEKSFQNISNYIINNPMKWSVDKSHQ